MRISRLAILISLLSIVPVSSLEAQSVRVEAGKIVYVPASGAPRRLTATGLDSMPVLSPDGRTVAFVRRTPGDTVPEAPEPTTERTELWMVGVDGTGARRLARGEGASSPERLLANFADPRFSPDGRRIYFLSSAWATSSAVHAVDLRTGAVTYVCPGNSLEVVPGGEYVGHLVVEQHRYFVGGGSYDWYWLVAPDGMVVGPIGETLDLFRETYGGA